MKIRHSNAHAAITVIVLVAILFIGMYVMMSPFAKIFSMFADEEKATVYTSNTTCLAQNNTWVGGECLYNEVNCEAYNNFYFDGACYDLPERAHGIIFKQRRVWLIAPIIFIVGLIFWYITVSTKKDPLYFQQGPGGGL